MQMVLAAIYHKYNTRVSPKTTDESMKVLDQITSAGPEVPSRSHYFLTIRATTVTSNFIQSTNNDLTRLYWEFLLEWFRLDNSELLR